MRILPAMENDASPNLNLSSDQLFPLVLFARGVCRHMESVGSEELSELSGGVRYRTGTGLFNCVASFSVFFVGIKKDSSSGTSGTMSYF